jgi:hypothetical protein
MFVRTPNGLCVNVLQTNYLDAFWARLHYKVLMIAGIVAFKHCTVHIVVRPAMTSE